jgi:putative ABC transport system ATP-binding protein
MFRMAKEIIKLSNVCKNYQLGDSVVKAVCEANLVIKKGEFIAIVGPSGSGKSTLMNLVGALDLASKGEIYLDNQNIEELEESELAQIRGRKIGFVFQTFNLIPTLTAKENVMLPMLFQNTTKKEREERSEKLLKQVGLGERMNFIPGKMSGGERQRVAIARALANNPEVILADEPTGNLDSKTGKKVIEILKKLNREGKTIIMVTHDLNMAEEAKRIIKLKDGRVE